MTRRGSAATAPFELYYLPAQVALGAGSSTVPRRQTLPKSSGDELLVSLHEADTILGIVDAVLTHLVSTWLARCRPIGGSGITGRHVGHSDRLYGDLSCATPGAQPLRFPATTPDDALSPSVEAGTGAEERPSERGREQVAWTPSAITAIHPLNGSQRRRVGVRAGLPPSTRTHPRAVRVTVSAAVSKRSGTSVRHPWAPGTSSARPSRAGGGTVARPCRGSTRRGCPASPGGRHRGRVPMSTRILPVRCVRRRVSQSGTRPTRFPTRRRTMVDDRCSLRRPVQRRS